MRNYLKIGPSGSQIDTRDYGIFISGPGTFSAPAREYDFIQVPGRNGDIVGNEKRLANIEVTYPAFCYTNTKTNIKNFRNALLSKIGYQELRDSYNTDEYRMGVYTGPFEPEMLDDLKSGSFDLVFNCKPERYLTSGETVTTLTQDGTINNPTYMPSAPLLRVYGAGVLGLGSDTITISAVDGYVDIDCEIMEAYKGTTSYNSNITVTGADFPKLKSGTNNITLGTGITKVEITPRWWQV